MQEIALTALCALTKDGGEEGRCSVAESGAIPALVFQLQNGSPAARAEAARCIRFLCRSSNPLITQAAASAVPFLATLLQQVCQLLPAILPTESVCECVSRQKFRTNIRAAVSFFTWIYDQVMALYL